MRKLLFAGLFSGLTTFSTVAATSPIYINNSPLLAPPAVPPQIDATAFVNQSTFDINTFSFGFIIIIGDQAFALNQVVPPYKMMNTQFVTNAPGAVMSGSPGYEFDYFSSSNNARLPLDRWENRGRITADPMVKVFATNILNRGPLEATEAGLIRLRGTNVDVSRSTLLVGTGPNTPPPFGGDIFGTNHFNAPGVTDLYWGAGLNNRVTNGGPPMRLDVPGFTSTNVSSPPHQVVRRVGNGLVTNLVTLSAAGFTPYVYTNQTGPDTFQYQVVFVGPTGDSNITSNVEFFTPGVNGGADVLVSFESADPDIITGSVVTNGVYLVDYSAFTTNIGVTWNGFTGPLRTRRPDTYEFFRQRPFFFIATPTNANGTFTETSLYTTNMATNFVNMGYAAYSASFGTSATNIVSGVGTPLIPPPGRVEIYGDQVNLNRTRIRAETTVIIKARDVGSNAAVVVDAPFLEFDIGSSASPLVIRELAPPSVRRFSGQIQAWSGVWQNSESISNVDTNGNTNTVTTTTDYHVLIVDPFFSAEVFVTVNDLLLAAEQLEIADSFNVSRRFRIDARDWTVTETAFLQLPLMYGLGPSNVINLVNFTNRGIIDITGLAEFGQGLGATPLASYVIAPGSSFSAGGHSVSAATVQIGGALTAVAGGINIRADSVNLSGNLASTSDIDIRAPIIVASNSFISAGSLGAPASLIFDAPDTFVDAGTGEGNDWSAFGGIQVLSLPSTGDLLGTIVRVQRPDFGEALVVWPSADLGPSAGGFANNLALGQLILSGGTFSLFRFEGVQEPGAIYIDYLELNGVDPVDEFEIEPGMTVYFASSNVDPTVLDGLHGGRLRFVPDFAGPLSSTNIVYPTGETYTLNAALVRSMVLDSDGDGIVNGLDSTPIIVGDRIGLQIAATRGEPTKTVISWMAPANSTSIVEYKNSLNDATWQALPAVENGSTAQRLSISDVPPGTSGQRFYRVRTQLR